MRNVTFTAHVVENGEPPPPGDATWKLNGTAKRTAVPSAGSLQLTPPKTASVAGSAFYPKSLPSRYLHVGFDTWIGGGSGADGMALVLADAAHTTPAALGAIGGGLGFTGIPGFAFALDTNKNTGDPAANFVGVSDGPSAPGATLLHWIATSAAIPALEDIGATPPTGYRRTHIDVQIADGLATVKVGGVVALTDVPVTLPSKVFVGFTGANGGRTDEHTIANVRISVVGPATTVTAKPAATIGTASATFAFTANVAGSTFRCSLDNAAPRPCASPHTVSVAPGAHKLSIQAVDPSGIAEETPALARWSYVLPTLHHGYWMLGADGSVYGFGDAQAYGHPNDATAVHLTPTHTARGYWIVNRAGRVYAFGDAPLLGSAPALAAGEQATSISATKTDKGYWVFTSAGRVFAFGDAKSYGDLRGVHLNGSVIDSVPTASGRGYYMIASDGGVFAFGDARFHGSLGATRLNQPIIGLVPTPTGRGYWLDASDGGVFAFGDAPFRGSLGSVRLNRPIVGMVAFGNGYLLGASDGGVFDYSSSPFLGSLADHVPSAPIVGLAAFGQ